MSYILILIYTGMSMVAEPRANLGKCVKEAHARIGEPMKVQTWDTMNGSHPIPKVATAFCVLGASAEAARQRK